MEIKRPGNSPCTGWVAHRHARAESDRGRTWRRLHTTVRVPTRVRLASQTSLIAARAKSCRWRTHFEKMLYDNAQLARVYLHAYQVTGNEFYKRIATEILDHVVREMTSPEGGFYSSQNADSEGHEGKFFVRTPEEIRSVLGESTSGLLTVSRKPINDTNDAQLFLDAYGVTPPEILRSKSFCMSRAIAMCLPRCTSAVPTIKRVNKIRYTLGSLNSKVGVQKCPSDCN